MRFYFQIQIRYITSFDMESDTLVLRVQWNWGDSKIVHTPSSSSIGGVLSSHGFHRPGEHQLLVAYKSELTNLLFSFHYYHVFDLDRLICLAKKIPSKSNSLLFLKSCEARAARHHQPAISVIYRIEEE
jgi:hypothetical protein